MKRWHIRRIVMAALICCQAAGVTGQDRDDPGLRAALMELIDSAWSHGLDSSRITCWRQELQQGDKPWTNVAFGFLKDLRNGYGIAELVSYDGISPVAARREDDELTAKLAKVRTDADLKALASDFIPRCAIYDTLRAALVGVSCNASKARQLAAALNLYRWIHHFHWPRCIVVNIAAAHLTYFENDAVRLQMKIVAGQPSKRTPRMAAWCDELILYPYWNIPRKIAVNEFFPLFRVSPQLAGTMNIQLFDKRGKVIDPTRISWWRWNKENFPYSMRQSTGCDNALGVIKFNLTSPYDVYMHDTNFKLAFLRGYRWLSHGCIRLEKPVELGDLLLDHRLDTTLLQSCLRDQQPRSMRLTDSVPVFVIYQTVVAEDDGKLRWMKDIYHLMD
ncbi:MAG TPA: L,D-transpeptidase family protein [Puia sp.]|nr:L,D-transpeptidase family protein [Puia sp.]